MCYVCHRPGELLGLLGWERRGGSLGDAGLEMTQCEGRAPIPQNQSSHLQGEGREDKDASPHRRANTHTHHGRCTSALRCALTQTHGAESNILCVIFKYGLKKDYAGDDTGQLWFQDTRGT